MKIKVRTMRSEGIYVSKKVDLDHIDEELREWGSLSVSNENGEAILFMRENIDYIAEVKDEN